MHYDNYNLHCVISIHALLAESDTPRLSRVVPTPIFLSTLSLRRATRSSRFLRALAMDFYPRSPCGERPCMSYIIDHQEEFLSTLSLRRATAQRGYILLQFRYFYPRSPCGERRCIFLMSVEVNNISIHALLAESDPAGDFCFICTSQFLSTLSLRRATRGGNAALDGSCISIHALLAESDCIRQQADAPPVDFYPRSPCGERPAIARPNGESGLISIHALLAESDGKRTVEINIMT